MAITDYTAALKKGKRNYQLALARGAYPYLPALDDILSYTSCQDRRHKDRWQDKRICRQFYASSAGEIRVCGEMGISL